MLTNNIILVVTKILIKKITKTHICFCPASGHLFGLHEHLLSIHPIRAICLGVNPSLAVTKCYDLQKKYGLGTPIFMP